MTARDRLMLIAVVVIAALAGAWMFVIKPKRDQAAKLGDQITAVQSQLTSARSQMAAGLAAQKGFDGTYGTLVGLGEAVPADDDVSSLIVQIQAAASKANVDFRTLSLSSGSGSASPAAPASATQTATASLPPGVTAGAAGFPSEPFNFTFQGNFFHLADFLGRIERFVIASNDRLAVSGRLMTLNAISLAAGPNGFPQITATVSATTYLLPSGQGLLNGATAAGPAGVPASQPATAQSTAAPSTATASVKTTTPTAQ
jgi:hypothetical protein